MSEFKNMNTSINLKDIKCSNVIKGIFSFLDEKQKLNLIVYNKKIQSMFSVEIENYKIVSGKYKDGTKNGKGKEYDLNTKKVLFTGQYVNGKRNGKGKEYNNYGMLVFEGEYINGKRNGKGKEYFFNSKTRFEGEYLKGKRWNGKGYNKNGNLEFEMLNGNGQIKEYYDNGKILYEGEYLNGERK